MLGVADRHANKELKKQVRGIRPIERHVEQRIDPEAVATRAYCLAATCRRDWSSVEAALALLC